MTLTPFLMFQGQAEEAIRFYVSVLPDAEILDLERYGPGDPDAEGQVKQAKFRIGNQTLMAIDSPLQHAFGFTPALSLFLDLTSESEADRLFGQLSGGGEVFMPLGEYPFARRFAWLADRYGVSWQLSVA
jgi:predicted 3-demethylubiquinone-9 3-methyltransferase (glyoxalase superfamily)